jgi:ribosomal protein S18 acetylase RimI-like enzyme
MPDGHDALAVRPAREAEIEPVAQMWAAMYAYQREHGMMLPLRDDAAEIWKRSLAGRLDSPVSVILVAEVAGSPGPAGFLSAQVKRLPPHLSTERPKVGFISEVYVDPAQRRHRVGRRLVDAAFAWFARAEVGSIELQVVIHNDVARAFWESFGFQAELVQMRARLPGGSAPPPVLREPA